MIRPGVEGISLPGPASFLVLPRNWSADQASCPQARVESLLAPVNEIEKCLWLVFGAHCFTDVAICGGET